MLAFEGAAEVVVATARFGVGAGPPAAWMRAGIALERTTTVAVNRGTLGRSRWFCLAHRGVGDLQGLQRLVDITAGLALSQGFRQERATAYHAVHDYLNGAVAGGAAGLRAEDLGAACGG